MTRRRSCALDAAGIATALLIGSIGGAALAHTIRDSNPDWGAVGLAVLGLAVIAADITIAVTAIGALVLALRALVHETRALIARRHAKQERDAEHAALKARFQAELATYRPIILHPHDPP